MAMSFDINDANPSASQSFTVNVNFPEPAVYFVINSGMSRLIAPVWTVTQSTGNTYIFKVTTTSLSDLCTAKAVTIYTRYSTCFPTTYYA